MVDIISLAHGVAEKIGGADVELAPEYTLKDVKEKTRIVVVPVGIKHRMLWRFPNFFFAGEALRRPARFQADFRERALPFKFDLRCNTKC